MLLGDVVDVDLDAREVTLGAVGRSTRVAYDTLIVAAGAGQSYFGHDEFGVHAPGLKTIDDALEVRGRLFGAFELAELEHEERQRDALSTKVTSVDENGLDIVRPDGSPGRIEARTKVWAAGVKASALGGRLAEQSGAAVDRSGRVAVLPDCTRDRGNGTRASCPRRGGAGRSPEQQVFARTRNPELGPGRIWR